MKPRNPYETVADRRRRVRILITLAVALGSFAAAIPGCSLIHSKSVAPAPPSTAAAESSAAPSPQAKIHVSYARKDDFITSLAVTKYFGADTLLTTPGKDGTASILRFDGGVVVWQFGVSKGFLAGVPVIGPHEDRPYQVAEIQYAVVPKGFTQQIPESGPPEPLESDHFYVFAVTRASGSVSYEAVKVNGDGTLEAYAAEPRAGTSYRLCCNIAADFTITPAAAVDEAPMAGGMGGVAP